MSLLAPKFGINSVLIPSAVHALVRFDAGVVSGGLDNKDVAGIATTSIGPANNIRPDGAGRIMNNNAVNRSAGKFPVRFTRATGQQDNDKDRGSHLGSNLSITSIRKAR